MLRTIFIHFLLYLRSCFIGVLQFGILISLVSFLKGNENIGLSISLIALIITLIISLPFYLLIIGIITIKKINSKKIYIVGAMLVAASFPIYMLVFDDEPKYFSGILLAVIFSFFGIIPGKMYYKSCNKYFPKKE